jgi:hypothetical protein
MTLPRKESSLLTPAANYYRRRGYKIQKRELQFFEYSVDLYAYNKTKDLTIAVELKLTDWRRAVNQAVIYSLCADVVTVCVPKQTATRIDLDFMRRFGIGLLSFEGGGRCRQMLAPRKSTMLRDHYRDYYVTLLTDKRNGRS